MKHLFSRDNAAISIGALGCLLNVAIAVFNTGAWVNWTAGVLCGVIATVAYIRKP